MTGLPLCIEQNDDEWTLTWGDITIASITGWVTAEEAFRQLLVQAARQKRNQPPAMALDRKPSKIYAELVKLADTPGEWGHISTHKSPHSAGQTVTDLRTRKRKVPPGEWEFRHGPIDNSRQFGVWARLKKEEGEHDTTTDAG